tara:strand:- start:1445 stop:1642 length:198 start_codon:yes stop_codon:yes gene_type:complete
MVEKQILQKNMEKSYIEIMLLFSKDKWFSSKMKCSDSIFVQEKVRTDLKLLHKKFNIHRKLIRSI